MAIVVGSFYFWYSLTQQLLPTTIEPDETGAALNRTNIFSN